jgi:putative FmdB family regulatory protein
LWFANHEGLQMQSAGRTARISSIFEREVKMPIYQFQCECGIRFEASAAMKDHAKPKPCPDCTKLAPRHLPEGINGVFNLTTSGVGPQNTGVTELDANLDRVVGEDAKKGWKAIEERDKVKRATLHSNPGATNYDLSKNPDGSYRVMKPTEKAAHARAFTINHMAAKQLKDAPIPR